MPKGHHLDEKIRLRILKARQHGLTYEVLRQRFGISETTVRDVCNDSPHRNRRHTAGNRSRVHRDAASE